jgi:iron complex outermembrane receptor protein
MSLKRATYLAVSAALVLAPEAMAQTAAPADPTRPEQQPADAASAANSIPVVEGDTTPQTDPGNAPDQSQGITDIVVTANRREERLQDVPISVAAFGSELLKSAGAQNVQDLGNITPGLTMSNQSAGVTPFIRGIGAVDNTLGQEAAVAVYVDGVYYPSVYASLFSFNNIQRIEVLKGPQGTLFGRNATGGLIQVITRDPARTPTLEGSVSYGNYDTVRAQAYVSGGITDQLAVDLAVLKSYQGKGYGRNFARNSEVGFGGNDSAIRGKLMWTPTDQTTIKLAGDYSLTDHSDLGATKTFLPGSISSLDGLGRPGGWWDVRGGAYESLRSEQYGGSLHIDQDFGFASFVSISALRRSDVKQSFDNDATPVVALDAYIDSQRVRTFTQEVQLLSDPGNSIRWIIGGFYLRDKSAFAAPNGLGLFGSAVGTATLIQNQIKTRSLAAYGEVTIPLASNTDLTGGIRYTDDKRKISGKIDVLSASVPGAPVVATIPSAQQTFKEGQPSWRVVLNHKFTPDIMVYASYNRGFKSGNFNTTSAADAPFQSEKVDAYEIGLKSDLFDRRLRFNIAAFHYDYSNLQLSVLKGFNLSTINAANSRINGVDVDGELAITQDFRFRFGAAYLDAKFNDFPNAQCSSRSPSGLTTQFTCDAGGNRLTRSPKFTATASPSYGFDTEVGRFNASATYTYNSGFFWEPDNRLKQSAYHLLSGQIGWTETDDHLGFRLFAKNLLNEEYALWQVAFAFGDEYAAAPPRTYGAELTFKF